MQQSTTTTTTTGPEPMDVEEQDESTPSYSIDPVDDGPVVTAAAVPPLPVFPPISSSSVNNNSTQITTITKQSFNEEEAKICLEKLQNSDDLSSRVQSAYLLDSIAVALGPQRTRNELIPFIIDNIIIDDDDEVLLAVAITLRRMVNVVGGLAYVAKTLYRPLELLLTIEETTVRDAASESAISILEQISTLSSENNNVDVDESNNPNHHPIDEFANMIIRLAGKEWFTARLSAAKLLSTTYPKLRLSAQQKQYIELFQSLCHDETPMVRRVAAKYLGILLMNVSKVMGRDIAFNNNNNGSTTADEESSSNNIIERVFLPLYEQFADKDQPDSVRLQTTENCVSFGQVLTSFVVVDDDNDKTTNTTGSSLSGLSTSTSSPRKVLVSQLSQSELSLLNRILPLIKGTIDDRSWRVRWTAASKFANVVKAFDQLPDTMDTLVPAYEKLLQDPEAEVRTAATFNLAHVAQCNHNATVPLPSPTPTTTTASSSSNTAAGSGGGSNHNPRQQQQQQLTDGGGSGAGSSSRVSVAERLVKRVTSLTEDDSEHVRAALAMVATELAPALGKDATITYLVPPVLLLLRDAASEVRLNLISSLSALNEVIGVDLLSQSLLPAILDLAQDGKWRIRLAIIQHIPLLAKQLGKEFFTEKLSSLCVGWLGDDIASIRQAAAANLKELTALFGTDWAIENLIPPVLEIREHQSYLRRLTALKACSMMAGAMDADTARIEVLPVILEMAADIVPNIRFNVAKELQGIASICGSSTYESQVLPVLSLLLEDEDRDVRDFAQQTSTALEKEFEAVAS